MYYYCTTLSEDVNQPSAREGTICSRSLVSAQVCFGEQSVTEASHPRAAGFRERNLARVLVYPSLFVVLYIQIFFIKMINVDCRPSGTGFPLNHFS